MGQIPNLVVFRDLVMIILDWHGVIQFHNTIIARIGDVSTSGGLADDFF